jgi:hypothetical protein
MRKEGSEMIDKEVGIGDNSIKEIYIFITEKANGLGGKEGKKEKKKRFQQLVTKKKGKKERKRRETAK